ncbi:hypothetical protein [Streptomyces endophyticus]|uniref:Uncharacterized protein n=1 Tax=Streptomyces endophyticus TaxID=714166 RepID=A0ABU6F0Q2_9ACTN|nr:hypothetical protein [Streptomyces endophyticus]MEB8337580.1 hypothetical protein [Streptomyces endophyticus]
MNSGGDHGSSSLSDEDWERFLQESEDGVRDAPKEPSARARMVTRRLREEDARPEPWRSHQPPRPRRRTGWYALGLVAALAVVVVALAPGRVPDWFTGDSGAATPLAAETARPTAPPPGEAAARPTLDEPFRGSPAARWASGTAGITLPAARATGWMSRTQVARALERSRDFLAASSLDPGVLRGEHPSEAIALINPHQPKERSFLDRSLSRPSEKYNPLVLFSRFDTLKAELVGDVVKTRGRVTYGEGDKGALRVTTDVTYVYPVMSPEAGDDRVTRVIVRREVVMNWPDPARVITEPGTFSVVSNRVDTTNAGCDTYTGYLTPSFAADLGSGDGAVVDPYDRSTAMDERAEAAGDERCGTATRS